LDPAGPLGDLERGAAELALGAALLTHLHPQRGGPLAGDAGAGGGALFSQSVARFSIGPASVMQSRVAATPAPDQMRTRRPACVLSVAARRSRAKSEPPSTSTREASQARASRISRLIVPSTPASYEKATPGTARRGEAR